MAKIFQLELFIKEMSIWKLPHTSEEHDETCVEVTVFHQQNVPINGYVFGKNSTMNRGQNFLFTLSAMPADENKVFFNVFKKAYNREKNFLGRGNIPINQIFGDLLSNVFKSAPPSKVSQIQNDATMSSMNDPQVASVAPKDDPQPANKNTSQTKANTQEGPKQNPRSAEQNQTVSKRTGDDVAPAKDSKESQPGTSQSKPSAWSSSKQSAQDAEQKQDDPNLESTNNQPIVNQPQSQRLANDPQANISPIKNLKTVNIASSTQGSPISSLSKDVYPIIGCDSQQWGTICILMRLTCFGYFSAHPILIHQNHKEIILQNTPNSATYKCVPLDDLRDNNRKGNAKVNHSPDFRRQQKPSVYCTDVAKTYSSGSGSSSSSSTSSSSSKKSITTARTYSNLCPGPPASPSGQYEEFTAEINENILCVRMPKNVGIIKRIYDHDSSKRMNSLQGCSDHVRRIPVVRGNRKYPAHYGSISSLPSVTSDKNFSMHNQLQRETKDKSIHLFRNQICDEDNISCPSNVQIIRTNNDPKRDVFLLKIGKDTRSGNGIQLEMKTPKNPFARSNSANKQTTSVQTYDDEFVSGRNKGSKGGKKRGKKGNK